MLDGIYKMNARKFAKKALKGHMRADGRTVYNHSRNVVNLLIKLYPYATQDELDAAILHDCMERNPACISKLTLKFNSNVCGIVHRLSRNEVDSRKVYLQKNKMCNSSRMIKIVDIMDAMMYCRDKKKIKRYNNELNFLLTA